jgi:ornithine carbamoyltransferase
LRGKDFLTLGELDPGDLRLLLSLSSKLKVYRKRTPVKSVLGGKTVALIFEKPSTRTRVSFQVATHELGGHSVSLSANELQLGRGETIEDTARVLSRYVHSIMARVNVHDSVAKLAAAASVPVINGLSDLYHPVQILADLFTLQEYKGNLKGLKVAWVGDGNNVCNSWLLGASLAGISFAAATPPSYRPLQSALVSAEKLAESTGGDVTITDDPVSAVSGADCVMTDTFVSMGFDKEREDRIRTFLPKYQVNQELMSRAKKDAVFEHCLPAHRGEEVTSPVIDGPNSVVWDQAENRLHTTKALLCFLMLGKTGTTPLLRSR